MLSCEAALAAIRQRFGGTPSRRTSAPDASRASSSPSRFDAVPPIVITPDPPGNPCSSRKPRDERVLHERRRRRGVERVHRLVRDADRQLRDRGLDQRRGVEVRDAVRVPEPDPALEDRREVVEDGVERRAVLGERVDRGDGGGERGGIGERGPGGRRDGASDGSGRASRRAAGRGDEHAARLMRGELRLVRWLAIGRVATVHSARRVRGTGRVPLDRLCFRDPGSSCTAPRARRRQRPRCKRAAARAAPSSRRHPPRPSAAPCDVRDAAAARRHSPAARRSRHTSTRHADRQQRARRRPATTSSPVKSGNTTTSGPHGASESTVEPPAEVVATGRATAATPFRPASAAPTARPPTRGTWRSPHAVSAASAGSTATIETPGNAVAAQRARGQQRDHDQLRADHARAAARRSPRPRGAPGRRARAGRGASGTAARRRRTRARAAAPSAAGRPRGPATGPTSRGSRSR